MPQRPLSNASLALLLACCLSASAPAQLPSVQLNTVFPAGGKQGASIDVTFAGANLESARQVVFSHGGITGQIKQAPPNEFVEPRPVPGQFQVTIAEDVPPGVYDVRLVGQYGASNPRSFVVGSLDEVQDNGGNRSHESAQEVAVGTVVNGRTDGSQIDYYKVSLKKGQRILVECLAWRIDSRLDPVLVVQDATGRQLAVSHDYDQRDPFIDFSAPADGEYWIGIHDLLFGGGGEHVYRLTVHAGPHVDFVFPPSGAPGSNSTYTVYGRNLPGGKPGELRAADGTPLEQLTLELPIPDSHQGRGAVVDYAALPTSLLASVEQRIGDVPVRIGVARAEQVVAETEPNDTPDQATELPGPCEAAGQFYPARDEDWFQFAAKKGDVLIVEVISQRLGLDTDPVLLLQRVDVDDQGAEQVKEVAFVDDPRDRNNRVNSDFDTSTDDPSYRLEVPSDGLYRVNVRDQFGDARSDPRMVYRLAIRREQPDFRLIALAREIKVANNNQVPVFTPAMRQGGSCSLQLQLERIDGFAGEVQVRAEGLPEGVHCPGATFGANATSVTLVFYCDESAQPWSGTATIVGTAQIGDQQVARHAALGTVVWGTTNRGQTPAEFRAMRDLVISVADETDPASVVVGDGSVLETSLGGKLEVPVKVTRRNGLAENLKLVATGLPNEVKPGDITINNDKSEGTLTILINNAKAKPDVYSFFLRADTKVKYALNASQVTEAEEVQKQLDEVIKQLAEDVKAKTELAQQAKQQAESAAKQAQDAEQANKSAAAAADQAAKAAAEAADAAAKAAAAAREKSEDEGLQKAAQDAQQQADAARKAQEEAAKKAAEAAQGLKDAQAKAEAAKQAQQQADQQLKELQDRSKRAGEAKKQADKRVADTKKAAAPKDVNFAVVSTPITLRVVPTPLTVSAPGEAELQPGAKVSVPLKLDKKYGFDENVEVTVELPKGVSGVTAGKLTIAKGQTEGQLELTANDKPTAGSHTITVQCKGQFNKVNIQASHSLVLKVAEPQAK